ncbi:MAG: ATP-binding cassette domain-containing protein [Caldilineaceae bacterium]
MATVELRQITKRFRGITALQEVSFEIQDGEFFVLLGPTGAGKTTTLRVIAGLEKQDAGCVFFDGKAVDAHSPAERDIAFVFQQYSLYPTMSVYDNLAFPLRSPLRKTPEDEIKRRVTETAEKLRISHLLERKTARLSGGEMQRVSIGRAIVRQPRIFLMDEPLSNLDAKLRESLRIELEHIQKTQHSTTLYVTHDQVEALTLADRIAVMRQGRIVQVGTPQDIYDRPANTFVAQLVGSPRINLLPAQRVENTIHIANSSLQLSLPPALYQLPAKLTVGIRPEDIVPAVQGAFTGEVVLIEPLGSETILYLRSGEETLVSTVSGMVHWRIGELLHFNLVQEHLHYFDQNGQRIVIKALAWEDGIAEEITFWEEWLATGGGKWPDDFHFRFAPDSPLQAHITQVLDIPDGTTVNILDVGAGPLTYLGKQWPGHPLTITAIDPLAEEYDQLLTKYQLTPPVRTQKGEAEQLTAHFDKDTFDLVHARNCIDHSHDPCLAIQQMVAVTKPGGLVYMHHAVNEAQQQQYQGFHQWNLFDKDGDLYAGNAKQEINLSKLLESVAEIENHLFDNGIWMVSIIRKKL